MERVRDTETLRFVFRGCQNWSFSYLGHWKVEQEHPVFKICLSLSSPEVYPQARIQVQVACLEYERNTSGEVRQGEKAANRLLFQASHYWRWLGVNLSWETLEVSVKCKGLALVGHCLRTMGVNSRHFFPAKQTGKALYWGSLYRSRKKSSE